MAGPRDYLDGLVQLSRVRDPEERRATWRQSLATLATAIASQQPLPLEGRNPGALLAGVSTALETNLVDDLGFLSPPAAAAAIYELAAAIPMGRERRELGRRVLLRLYDGDAATFVALATQLTLGSRRGLSGGPMRARVALCLDLPLGAGASADTLALALISRRDTQREWLTIPATGLLPSRRLAARLLERAAREAALRASRGDESGLRVFGMSTVQASWVRLLAERESLVWRHVATARGLLARALPDLGAEIRNQLDPSLTSTEWRRAAASLAASIAIAPSQALEQAQDLLSGLVVKSDPGVAAAMILGLPRAAESEPEAAEELLESLVQRGGLDATEALVDLMREKVGGGFGVRACQIARDQLNTSTHEAADDGRSALVEALSAELAPEAERRVVTLPDLLSAALMTFAERGARDAHVEAHRVLEAAEDTMQLLAQYRDSTEHGRKGAFRALRELDQAILEKATLADLLTLGASEKDDRAGALGDLLEWLNIWLIRRERAPISSVGSVTHPRIRLRRMRTMLHLVDADGAFGVDQSGKLRDRRLRSARLLLRRTREDCDSSLRRVVCAAAARACDALVWDEYFEVSDVLIAAGTFAHTTTDLITFAEASMVPDVKDMVQQYAMLDRVATEIRGSDESTVAFRKVGEAMMRVVQALPVALSARVEALRASMQRLIHALDAIAAATSLLDLAGDANSMLLAAFEDAAQDLARLVAGARRRCGEKVENETPTCGAAIRLLEFGVERAIRGNPEALADALDSVRDALRAELPRGFAEAALVTLDRIHSLGLEAPPSTGVHTLPPPSTIEPPLPAWMPPGRTMGGFYVVRALGAGAVGSVFVARRIEERHNDSAKRFALKVPEYDGNAARILSEAEFLQLFREEAGTLLSLPHHPNLSSFVTFDAGARPKPILVMELVEGPSLERVIEMGDLDMNQAFDLLDGIAGGLEAMHEVGIGHLDVKPANVILRDTGPHHPRTPVLVDFGLAGRNLRPGCATGHYGAPEIWGVLPPKHVPKPLPADAYAFGCLVYEVLTGSTLFDGPNEIALVAAHVAHDGCPKPIGALESDPVCALLANLLTRALRKDPRERANVSFLRAGLEYLRERLSGWTWPISVP